VRWPGRIKPGVRIQPIAAAIDLLPTLADMAGVPLAAGKPLDGRSLRPLLFQEAGEWPDRMIFSCQGRSVSVRTQRHRLDAAGRLYDMQVDPGQHRDIARQQAATADRLRRAVEAWKAEVLAAGPRDDRPFPVGYPDFPLATLPARDGVPQGRIRRSASAPNCSFFTNWIRTEDAITWDIEVATAGRYEAAVDHTCSQKDVGAEVALSFGGARVGAVVVEAHDPPLLGAEHDRVPRSGESYVKDFRPLRLGTITLPKGRGTLTLRAVKIPGKQAIDVRSVTLKLLVTQGP
jgi:hypothetical protein